MEVERPASDAGAFRRIQVARYLASKRSGRFSGPAERDAVLAMIRDAWVELSCSVRLQDLSVSGRLALYSTCLIVFPSFIAEDDRVVTVDFPSKTRICAHLPRFQRSRIPRPTDPKTT